ncbi:phosphoribosyl transferase domain protein [Xylaria sp. FL1777]|nr:phosphoribosyl transferase domain protein [Xylaria sp. FL1777]
MADMATLESLKRALRQRAPETARQPLSDAQYSVGFDLLAGGSNAYQDFVVPQLSEVMAPLFNSRSRISVLEIGPGPKSVLGQLPVHMRGKIRNYTAFEPNALFATSAKEWFYSPLNKAPRQLYCLESSPDIYPVPFTLDNDTDHGSCHGTSDEAGKYDVILFCHSMYGMKPHHKYIERAVQLLDRELEGAMVIVFHRHGALDLAGLVCHQTATFPTGVVRVANSDEQLDRFASFVAGQDLEQDEAVRIEWREVCRALGRLEDDHPGDLLFSAPEVMMTFTQHATALGELTAHVPPVEGDIIVKNREARLRRPAAIVRPTEVQHIQHCVRWALKHGAGLTVLGGGHSSHCLWPSVVSIDMSAFDQVHILGAEENEREGGSDSGSIVLVEAGCKTGDIIQKTMAVGLTVPLGSRPSVGAGLWLQGGIGHLARLHGLACDAIIGAVLVSVDSGQILLVGRVPSQHQPAGAVRLENEADEADLLWALKGAGTNFGIVVSVTFKAYAAPNYVTRNWVSTVNDIIDGRQLLGEFELLVARDLPRNCSADAYLYWDAGQLHIGVTTFESSTDRLDRNEWTPVAELPFDQRSGSMIVDGVGLFEAEMYMSGMHGGHGGGKTSAFKRCLFLKGIGEDKVTRILVAAIEARPSPFCYLHLLQGGEAVNDIAADATAFGCRDWDFACVITGVWPRDQDGTEIARAAVQWVYDVVKDLLPLSTGAYGADLGPDPRDAALAAMAFGPNLSRLARIKNKLDSHNILAYTCPLPKAPLEPKVIILVTGESCAGKDFCAGIWASMFSGSNPIARLTTRVVSISDETKRAYATTSGADLDRLLHDRAYKEQHRPALTAFFQDQMRQRPRLREDHFLNVVYNARDVDVLFITGMREEAPVTTLWHLVPTSRLLDIQVRRGHQDIARDDNVSSNSTVLPYRPSFVFDNDADGIEVVREFAYDYLSVFFDGRLEKLADMVRLVPGFPRQGVDFRHVLDISQQPKGLSLCASLFRDHFIGDWTEVGAVVCCEAGGFVYAPVLASLVREPLALIREAGKLPPPTISVVKSPSHISSSTPDHSKEKRIEIGRDVIPKDARVVVVDDVLATGETLCAVLRLLIKAGVVVDDIAVMVLAEFPAHRGRYLLRERGFGEVTVQSLLVYGGV